MRTKEGFRGSRGYTRLLMLSVVWHWLGEVWIGGSEIGCLREFISLMVVPTMCMTV